MSRDIYKGGSSRVSKIKRPHCKGKKSPPPGRKDKVSTFGLGDLEFQRSKMHCHMTEILGQLNILFVDCLVYGNVAEQVTSAYNATEIKNPKEGYRKEMSDTIQATLYQTLNLMKLNHINYESCGLQLIYRYTLDELPPLLQRLKVRAESFDHWAVKVKEALEAKPEDKLELSDLRELVEEAEAQRFPESELLQTLIQAVTEAEKCATVAAHLATKKVRTRTRGSGEAKSRLTLEELRLFHEQIESLACVVREGEAVKELLTRVTTFQAEAIDLLNQEIPDSEVIAKMVDTGCSLDIDLPELPRLKHKLQQVSAYNHFLICSL
nr:lysine-specific demethylase 5B-like [Cherax quadricarinatus]